MESYKDHKKNIESCAEIIEMLKQCISSCAMCDELIKDDEFNLFVDEINQISDDFDKLTDDDTSEIIELYKKSMDKINKCVYYLDNQKLDISYVD